MPTLDPQGEYLTRVWRTSVYPLAERFGVPMKLPPVQPRSRLAHEAAQWAATQSNFDDYNAAVFRSFFERGEDIGEREVLMRIASDLQLDAGALGRALQEGEFAASVLADERAAEELGVTGVPAFVANRRAALSGVQTVNALLALVNSLRVAGAKQELAADY